MTLCIDMQKMICFRKVISFKLSSLKPYALSVLLFFILSSIRGRRFLYNRNSTIVFNAKVLKAADVTNLIPGKELEIHRKKYCVDNVISIFNNISNDVFKVFYVDFSL